MSQMTTKPQYTASYQWVVCSGYTDSSPVISLFPCHRWQHSLGILTAHQCVVCSGYSDSSPVCSLFLCHRWPQSLGILTAHQWVVCSRVTYDNKAWVYWQLTTEQYVLVSQMTTQPGYTDSSPVNSLCSCHRWQLSLGILTAHQWVVCSCVTDDN